MNIRWVFDQNKDTTEWRWLRIDPDSGQICCSNKSFKNLRDCQWDATNNGYQPGCGDLPQVDRRVIPQQYSKPPFVERRQQARAGH